MIKFLIRALTEILSVQRIPELYPKVNFLIMDASDNQQRFLDPRTFLIIGHCLYYIVKTLALGKRDPQVITSLYNILILVDFQTCTTWKCPKNDCNCSSSVLITIGRFKSRKYKCVTCHETMTILI